MEKEKKWGKERKGRCRLSSPSGRGSCAITGDLLCWDANGGDALDPPTKLYSKPRREEEMGSFHYALHPIHHLELRGVVTYLMRM